MSGTLSLSNLILLITNAGKGGSGKGGGKSVGRWVTIQGQHVHLGKGGVIDKGPVGVEGKKPSELKGDRPDSGSKKPESKILKTEAKSSKQSTDSQKKETSKSEPVNSPTKGVKKVETKKETPKLEPKKSDTQEIHSKPEQSVKNFKHPEGYKPPEKDSKPNSELPNSSRPAISFKEAKVVEMYTGSSFVDMNNGLRGKGIKDPGMKDLANILQNTISKVKPFKEPVAVERLVDIKGAKLEKMLKQMETAKDNGKPWKLDGFTSTASSLDKSAHAGLGSVRISLKVKRGLDASPYTQFPGQKELILEHGAKFKVVKIEKTAEGHPHIHLEQILGPPESIK